MLVGSGGMLSTVLSIPGLRWRVRCATRLSVVVSPVSSWVRVLVLTGGVFLIGISLVLLIVSLMRQVLSVVLLPRQALRPLRPSPHSGGRLTQTRLCLTSLGTRWQKNASSSAWTRELLMLVLATTTTWRQCNPPMLNLLPLTLYLSVATRALILVEDSTPLKCVPLMPRTPFPSGRTVRHPWPCFRPVEFLVELFLMRNSLDRVGLCLR